MTKPNLTAAFHKNIGFKGSTETQSFNQWDMLLVDDLIELYHEAPQQLCGHMRLYPRVC
jgi:hypothetical protein